MPEHRLVREVEVPAPLEKVFEFFSNAGNLSELTPPWLRFEILTPQPIEMRVGALIDYRLRIRGIPVRWRTRIAAWDPPHRFVDEQVRGPYRKWHHEHTFIAKGDGQTTIRDVVDYQGPGWFFEPLIHRLFIRGDVDRIFQYRASRLRELADLIG